MMDDPAGYQQMDVCFDDTDLAAGQVIGKQDRRIK
jgi:hypothetical protein